MNIVDLVLIGLIVLCLLAGVFLGFLKLSLPFVAAAAIWGSLRFQPELATWLETYFQLDPRLAGIAAYAIVVATALALAGTLGMLLNFFFKLGPGLTGWLNQLAGGAAGLALGILLATLLVKALTAFGDPKTQELLKESFLAGPLLELLELGLGTIRRSKP